MEVKMVQMVQMVEVNDKMGHLKCLLIKNLRRQTHCFLFASYFFFFPSGLWTWFLWSHLFCAVLNTLSQFGAVQGYSPVFVLLLALHLLEPLLTDSFSHYFCSLFLALALFVAAAGGCGGGGECWRSSSSSSCLSCFFWLLFFFMRIPAELSETLSPPSPNKSWLSVLL